MYLRNIFVLLAASALAMATMGCPSNKIPKGSDFLLEIFDQSYCRTKPSIKHHGKLPPPSTLPGSQTKSACTSLGGMKNKVKSLTWVAKKNYNFALYTHSSCSAESTAYIDLRKTHCSFTSCILETDTTLNHTLPKVVAYQIYRTHT
ncbi:hypothetical protein BJ138DRAFT_941534 [Hygrophoropsis aurantiaca]|uniref:Uncharacterized protein n=1 Tax=Hygrophoropsis aurantiaca TaxID=72124 RepID=A0ACB8ADF3_9AGAM|nr:hypothetical protein BJ138DRAFT_941534 [Hygrophoropsis aurantiaca]